MNYAKEIASALVTIKAVGFVPEKPITFKSGLISPVYIDNRVFPFHPHQWSLVIQGFEDLIADKHLEFDVIAGIATAGIPHSAALGYAMVKPSVFVRKESKDHGTLKLIEGGDVKGGQVILVEDHITTGGSSLKGVAALRDEGSSVTDCLAITSYGFTEADANFEQAQVTVHTLTTFDHILSEALAQGLFSLDQEQIIRDWFTDPSGWAKKYGHTQQ